MAYTFEQFDEAISKNHSTRQDFIKHIMTLASGMLAILAAFHTTGTNVGYVQFVYLCTLILLSTGILAGGITLYFNKVADQTMFIQMKEEMLKQVKKSSEPSKIVAYNPPKLFYICERVCYMSSLLSVISLACYSALK
jgi:hypothetical protein